jgi:hypothetical protein
MMFTRADFTFLAAAFASFLASVFLWFVVDKGYGMFVGLWVPSILTLWVGVRHAIYTAASTALLRSQERRAS